jgi:hypothetical protein
MKNFDPSRHSFGFLDDLAGRLTNTIQRAAISKRFNDLDHSQQ